MARLPVTFHPEAQEDYLTSLDWYAERSSRAAANFEKEFQRAITNIERAPRRWPRYRQCQRYILRQFPFSVVYKLFAAEILVVAVVHANRRPGYWADRL